MMMMMMVMVMVMVMSGFRLGAFAQEHLKRTEVVLNHLTDLPNIIVIYAKKPHNKLIVKVASELYRHISTAGFPVQACP